VIVRPTSPPAPAAAASTPVAPTTPSHGISTTVPGAVSAGVAVAASSSAPVAASGGAARPPVPPTTTSKAAAGGSPLKLILAGAGVIAVVAVAAFFALSGGGGHKKNESKGGGDTSAQLVDKTSSPILQPTYASNKTNATPIATTVARSTKEYVDSTILVENLDTKCTDKSDGCRMIYAVGPYRFRGSTLRIEFTLQVITPTGKGVYWKNDVDSDKEAQKSGDDGVQLEGESGAIWHIKSAGGVASEDHDTLMAGRYTGYWEFDFVEDPGTTLTFNYPDFENYITIPVPE